MIEPGHDSHYKSRVNEEITFSGLGGSFGDSVSSISVRPSWAEYHLVLNSLQREGVYWREGGIILVEAGCQWCTGRVCSVQLRLCPGFESHCMQSLLLNCGAPLKRNLPSRKASLSNAN